MVAAAAAAAAAGVSFSTRASPCLCRISCCPVCQRTCTCPQQKLTHNKHVHMRIQQHTQPQPHSPTPIRICRCIMCRITTPIDTRLQFSLSRSCTHSHPRAHNRCCTRIHSSSSSSSMHKHLRCITCCRRRCLCVRSLARSHSLSGLSSRRFRLYQLCSFLSNSSKTRSSSSSSSHNQHTHPSSSFLRCRKRRLPFRCPPFPPPSAAHSPSRNSHPHTHPIRPHHPRQVFKFLNRL